jgi:hypothetical protein
VVGAGVAADMHEVLMSCCKTELSVVKSLA